MVTVIGIDPGLASLGIAVVELSPGEERPLFVEVLRTAPQPKKRGVLATEDLAERTRWLWTALNARIAPVSAAAVCTESMSWPRNSGASARVALAWGALLGVVAGHGLPLVQVSPQELKRRLTGAKSASKTEIAEAVIRRWGWPHGMDAIPKSQREHGWDALGAVIACLDGEVLRLARQLTQPNSDRRKHA